MAKKDESDISLLTETLMLLILVGMSGCCLRKEFRYIILLPTYIRCSGNYSKSPRQ